MTFAGSQQVVKTRLQTAPMVSDNARLGSASLQPQQRGFTERGQMRETSEVSMLILKRQVEATAAGMQSSSETSHALESFKLTTLYRAGKKAMGRVEAR